MLEQELNEPQAAQSNLNSAKDGGMARWSPGVPSNQLKNPPLITAVQAHRLSSATFTAIQALGPWPEGGVAVSRDQQGGCGGFEPQVRLTQARHSSMGH